MCLEKQVLKNIGSNIIDDLDFLVRLEWKKLEIENFEIENFEIEKSNLFNEIMIEQLSYFDIKRSGNFDLSNLSNLEQRIEQLWTLIQSKSKFKIE